MGLLGDMKDAIDERALTERFVPTLAALESFLAQIAKSPLASPEGFKIEITVSKKPEGT